MREFTELIETRYSARGFFDPKRAITQEDLQKVLNAARWTPSRLLKNTFMSH